MPGVSKSIAWEFATAGSSIKYVIVFMVLLECKMDKKNSQCEHGYPMEQTRGLFCMFESVVARCFV